MWKAGYLSTALSWARLRTRHKEECGMELKLNAGRYIFDGDGKLEELKAGNVVLLHGSSS